MTSGPRMLRTSAFAIAFLVVLALCATAQAADNTYTVNTTADSPIATPGSTTCADALGTCSIRAAIDAANNNSGNDTIVVPAGRYDRTLGDTGEDNSLGDFNVANNGTLTIQGQTGDPKDVIISADGLDRVIEIDAGGTLTLTGVTIQDGYTGDQGGGILVNGGTVVPPPGAVTTSVTTTLTLNSSRVLKNVSFDDDGGGIWGSSTQKSIITLNSSNVDNNTASFEGGGIGYGGSGSILSMVDSTVNGNSTTEGPGGGIYDGARSSTPSAFSGAAATSPDETLHAERSSVSHNQASNDSGGGIYNDTCECQGSPGDVSLIDTHVDNNFASSDGGGIDNSGPAGNLTVQGGTVDGNQADSGRGGGIENQGLDLSVTDAEVDSNTADEGPGGGIDNNGGSLRLTRVSVDNNSAGTDADTTGRGGGVFSNGAQKPIIVSGRQEELPGTRIVDSSISKNHSWASGGGIWDNTGADIINTTIANNVADIQQSDGNHRGGGIFDHGNGMTLTNVTLAGNIVNGGSGGGIWAENVDPLLTNTIIADNEANDDPSTSDCGGQFYTTGGHNLDGNQSSGSPDQCGLKNGIDGDQTGKHARLGPLQGNGGPTLTRALLDGSPAIDGGDNSICAGLTTDGNTDPHDQRQAHRPAGPACDVGAYEANALADLSITKDASPNPAVVGGNVTYTLHAKNNGPDSLLGAVSVSDTLPASVSFVSSTPSQGSCSGTSTVTCNLGGLAAGATATVTIVVRTNAPGTISNTAVVSGGSATDPNGANNTATTQSSVVSLTAAQAGAVPPQVLAQLGACLTTPPRTSISLNGLIAATDTLRFVGRSIDLRCLSTTRLGIKNVQIAVAFIVGSNTSGATAAAKKCRFLNKKGHLGKARSCKKPKFLKKARRGKVRNGKVPWTFRIRHLRLPPGRYLVFALGTDSAGHKEKKLRKYNQKTFTVKP
ncbi:MAG: choice-of-anchor Q domain-containing protein [Thermoleophilaceae bacterium]